MTAFPRRQWSLCTLLRLMPVCEMPAGGRNVAFFRRNREQTYRETYREMFSTGKVTYRETNKHIVKCISTSILHFNKLIVKHVAVLRKLFGYPCTVARATAPGLAFALARGLRWHLLIVCVCLDRSFYTSLRLVEYKTDFRQSVRQPSCFEFRRSVS